MSGRTSKRRFVTSEEFEIALNGLPDDPQSLERAKDNRSVIAAMLRRYVGRISPQELRRCGLHALWRCLGYHDPNHPSNQKFTTSLCRFVLWECKREMVRIAKQSEKREIDRYYIPVCKRYIEEGSYDSGNNEEQFANKDLIAFCLSKLQNKNDEDIIRKRFFNGMSLAEIADEDGCDKDEARVKLNKAMRALKKVIKEKGLAEKRQDFSKPQVSNIVISPVEKKKDREQVMTEIETMFSGTK